MNDNIIWAAGGLLTKETPEGKRVAVIHRGRHGSEWCLPKGKVQANESLVSGALREVKEETGCEAKVLGYAGTLQYDDEGRDKIVVFFHMELVGECEFEPNEEVDKLEWLTLEQTMQIIDHKDQQLLLAQQIERHETDVCSGWLKKLCRRICCRADSARVNRIQATIDKLELEIIRQRGLCIANKPDQMMMVISAEQMLLRARDALILNKIDNSWEYTQSTTRILLDCYGQPELDQTAVVLRREASKLKEWRKKAVRDLLGSGKKTANSVDVTAVRKAMEIRDENYSNQYFKYAVRGKSLRIVFWNIVLILIAILMLTYFDVLAAPSDAIYVGNLIAVMLMGALGASFSVAITLTHRDTSVAIPDQLLGSFVTWMRPVIGAAAALATYVFIHAEMMGFIANDQSTIMVLAFGFIAGFSERFVVNKMNEPSNK